MRERSSSIEKCHKPEGERDTRKVEEDYNLCGVNQSK
jgi:hypothetical protein